MRVKKRGKWRQILFLCAVLFLWESVVRRDHEVDLCRMQTVCAATTLKTGTQSELATSSAAETQIIDQLELTNLQDMVDAMLGDKTFSVTDTFHRLRKYPVPHTVCAAAQEFPDPCDRSVAGAVVRDIASGSEQ